jgi:hypothetical protein
MWAISFASGQGPAASLREYGNGPSSCVNIEEFLDQLSDRWFLEKERIPRS